MIHRFPYEWRLEDTYFSKNRGKVFSCFACGGGATMGYKLAGFDVIGCNEIDPRMMEVYRRNHNPKFSYLEPIQTFKLRDDLPDELYDLDILDGSPPCSSFSISGDREKAWGKQKKFREGQATQILDTLFFDFIDLAAKLRPKVVIAENVKGLLIGEAMDYTRRIYDAFNQAGYTCQHWLLNAADMGVPQRRMRVFFVAFRKDLASPFMERVNLFEERPRLILDFNEPPILFEDVADYSGREVVSPEMRKRWEHRQEGDTDFSNVTQRLYGKNLTFNTKFAYKYRICPTLVGCEECLIHFDRPQYLGKSEVCKISSFPKDFDFANQRPHYVCGMAVPPIMTANIATEIYNQWLSRL